MEPTDDFWNIFVRMSAAAFMGAALGWEREAGAKPAGLKTHMLVSLGAALFISMAVQSAEDVESRSGVTVDPMRVLQGIVGGIGFLGAGSIIQARGTVRGLTTAASIWLAAALGVGCGMGYFTIVTIGAGLALTILIVVDWIEGRVFPRKHIPEDDKP